MWLDGAAGNLLNPYSDRRKFKHEKNTEHSIFFAGDGQENHVGGVNCADDSFLGNYPLTASNRYGSF
jgi:hypothetical protein